MERFICDGSYEQDMKEYTEKVVEKYGVASPSAEREILCLADRGNTVAEKLYADLIFYQKILRKEPYREAFDLYMKSSGLTVDADGTWHCSGASYPLSFWIVGYYLANYRRSSFLRHCGKIEIIEQMPLSGRLCLALELAAACIGYTHASEASNLAGRILQEAAEDGELFAALQPVIREMAAGHPFGTEGAEPASCDTPEECSALSEKFFTAAAEDGYVYACNNLAARAAVRIVRLNREGGAGEEAQAEAVRQYIYWLQTAAGRYEPYAANRLGLFYLNGEIRSTEGTAVFREYVDHDLAKKYFLRATVYPDANSAWAYLNLIQHFHRDYTSDLERMNEHMDYIRELNPKVYDIAMEL